MLNRHENIFNHAINIKKEADQILNYVDAGDKKNYEVVDTACKTIAIADKIIGNYTELLKIEKLTKKKGIYLESPDKYIPENFELLEVKIIKFYDNVLAKYNSFRSKYKKVAKPLK